MLARDLRYLGSTHSGTPNKCMNKYVKVIVAIATIAGYYLLLRYIAPSREPYFILGIGVIGCVAWLFGIAAGIAAAVLVTPLTFHVYSQFEVAVSYGAFVQSPAYIALQVLTAVSLGSLRKAVLQLSSKGKLLMNANVNLQNTLSNVREMGGIHGLCTSCKSIQNDAGEWTKIDTYLNEKTKIEFSHGLCPECAAEYGNTSGKASEKTAAEWSKRNT